MHFRNIYSCLVKIFSVFNVWALWPLIVLFLSTLLSLLLLFLVELFTTTIYTTMSTINISFYFFLTTPSQALPITSQNQKSKNLRVVYQIVMQEVQRKFYLILEAKCVSTIGPLDFI